MHDPAASPPRSLDDIEVSMNDGEKIRVFEGLTPDESVRVVEVLEGVEGIEAQQPEQEQAQA